MGRLRLLHNEPVSWIKAIDCQNLLDNFDLALSTKDK